MRLISIPVKFCCALVAATAILINLPVMAQDMPTASEASPEIYKVLAENETMRVILGTWQPGERDDWHGHPPSSVFYVTDCHVRLFFPDGSVRDLTRQQGKGRARKKPVKSHRLENIGDKVCQILMTEVKIAE
ncbi:MAG: cupin domain-containing protein [Gammaproteobacteria bacterium]|nr:cupin domain-containing protein [Gammaproteobacteria bacterium]